MNYKEAVELAKAYDSKLLATDPRFQQDVSFQHEDGSYFYWRNAFLMEKDKWVFVFTEHFGFHVFDHSDGAFKQLREEFIKPQKL